MSVGSCRYKKQKDILAAFGLGVEVISLYRQKLITVIDAEINKNDIELAKV